MTKSLRRIGAIVVTVALALAASSAAEAKTPGSTYCYLGTCHRVLTLRETAEQIGTRTTVKASYYDVPWRDPFNPSMLTSSGVVFQANRDDSAASPIFPDGTRLLIWEPITGGAAVVRVNNAGPYYGDRMLDLSRGAADKLGLSSRGVGHVELMVLSAPLPQEATYVAGRVYDPVPGFIGSFESIMDAERVWRQMPRSKVFGGHKQDNEQETSFPAALVEQLGSRTALISGLGRGRSARGTRVVMLPVKQRRMAILWGATKRKAVAKN